MSLPPFADGGNSFYKDDIRWADTSAEKGSRSVDCRRRRLERAAKAGRLIQN